MKIALNMGQDTDLTGSAAQDKALERDVLAAKRGDWTAKENLARTFNPLLQKLAAKRSRDAAKVADLMKAGKDGLALAARKYKPADGPHKFRISAVDYVEQAMDKAMKGSLFARLFGRG